MPQISVVVPVYEVEDFLRECLESIARQTFDDLEVVMVDDGSTDDSAEIAKEFVERDARFKLLSQPNAGLGAARNTGIEAATGEYLAFVDSDDVLPPEAYERLHGALSKTGSQFATGNVLRLTAEGLSQARFLAAAFAETRLSTHVSEHRPLIADRTAWNKLFRRSFWDEQGYRFPEGVVYEDTPVTIPAHFSASAVDVISEPVYHWRIRDTGDLSITQRRIELKTLNDRLTSVEQAVEYLDRAGPPGARYWYEASVVADDLRVFLNAFDRAGQKWQEMWMERVNALLEGAPDEIFHGLMAIDRLKWHLVRRRMAPELVEVLRFQREEMKYKPPVKVGSDWYGDYPFRGDPARGIPDSVYRIDTLPPALVRLGWRVPARYRRRLKRLVGSS